MTIEFHCRACGKSLTSSNDQAGRLGVCPDCHAPQVIPDSREFETEEKSPRDDVIASVDSYEEIEQQSKICPMCGAENVLEAERCVHCGEELEIDFFPEGTREEGNFLIFSQVLNQTLHCFESNVGQCVTGVCLAFLLMFTGGVVFQLSLQAMGTGVLRVLRNPGQMGGDVLVVFGVGTLGVASWSCWLFLGLNRFLLGLNRRGDASIVELFMASWSMLWRLLFCSVLFGLLLGVAGLVSLVFILLGNSVSLFFAMVGGAVGVGVCCTIVLSQWCFPLLIADQNLSVTEAFNRTSRLMRGNYVTMFLVMFCVWFLFVLGAVIFGIGLLFTVPFGMLMLTVAYDQMTRDEESEFPATDSSF